MGPSKKCWFWCNGPSTKAPQIPLRHQKTFHLALFLSTLADTKKCCTFSGLELAQKVEKKLIGALSCMQKVPNAFNPSGTIRKKFLLCRSTRKARYVRSLGKKPHFWPSQRLKKVLLTAQGCARLRTGPIIMQIPRGYQKKKFIV